jgi:hypothetical protein
LKPQEQRELKSIEERKMRPEGTERNKRGVRKGKERERREKRYTRGNDRWERYK